MPALISIPEKSVERFVNYSLSDLLPEGDHVVLDRELHILSHIHMPEGFIMEQQSFTYNEYILLVALLESYPYFCPFATLLSTFLVRPVERCEHEIQIARREKGGFDTLMRPVRNNLSRIRIKLDPFGVDIKSIVETGYILWKPPTITAHNIS